VASTVVLIATWFIPEIRKKSDGFHYRSPSSLHFERQPAIRISGVDFVDMEFKSKKQELTWEMDYACEASHNDVVFAFQFERNLNNRSYSDHMFMLCNNHRVFGNGEMVFSGEEYIICTEEYAGRLKNKERALNVTMKAIDINTWESIEYESSSGEESCMMQHALDMLNTKW
jgi:hypothetical protein